MKKIFMAIAAMTMLIATSCKESANAPEDLVPGDGEFLVTIANAPRQEAPSNGKTVKTTIEGSNIIWQNLDSISINGVVYETNTTGSSAIFRLPASTAQPALPEDGKYKAYYPVEIAPTTEEASQLPDNIQYNGGNLKNLPMYAESVNNVLTFHNICAALRITVPNLGEEVTCNKIVISANENLAGEFSIKYVNDVPRAVLSTTAEGMSKKVTVTPADENGTFAGDVYVALPAGTYTYFAVEFWNGSNLVMRRMLAERTFEVNNLYNIAFGEFPADMFCFTANDLCTLKFDTPSLLNYYTTVTQTEGEPHNDWVPFPNVGLVLNAGDKVYIKAASAQNSLSSKSFTSEGVGTLTVSGNIMYLLDPTGCQKDFTANNGYAFNALFQDMSNLVDASGLILPATTLAEKCYMNMFKNCSALTAAPSLPATTLAKSCYGSMFRNCSTLTAAPSLPATTLAESCYSNMFFGCRSLTAAPDLHATTLAFECYSNMFYDCRSLTAAPDLHATTLATKCYSNMFYGCTSLTAAPDLHATTLANNCYQYMFYGCTSLTAAPDLHATTLANNCYQYMFYGCMSLGVSITDTHGGTTSLEVPSDANNYTDWCKDMFGNGVHIDFDGVPQPNGIYYFYGVSGN